MRVSIPWLLALLTLALPCPGQDSAAVALLEGWPRWRGPLGTGEAPRADPPVRWSETENIRWKTALPGHGHATPVVLGGRVFVATAVPVGEAGPPRYSEAPGGHDEMPITHAIDFRLLALDAADGDIVWERTLHTAVPHEGGHVTASLASASPVTDGRRLLVSFGSYGLYALDLDGELLWSRNLGRMSSLHGHGEGSSPALHGDTAVLCWDHEGPSFLVAFDADSGEERWRTERPRGSSWSTPVVVERDGRAEVIVAGARRLRSYALEDGALLWECAGLSAENVVATPVVAGDLVIAGSTYDSPGLLAVRFPGASGDLTGGERVAWTRRRGAPYVASPLLVDGVLYSIAHFQNVLTRLDAATGAPAPGAFRVDGLRSIFASPLAAAGRVYIPDRDGTTAVIGAGEAPEALALNRLDDSFSASPVAVGDALYLRGAEFLYCIAAD